MTSSHTKAFGGSRTIGMSLKESMLRTLQHDESRQYIHLDESILKGIDQESIDGKDDHHRRNSPFSPKNKCKTMMNTKNNFGIHPKNLSKSRFPPFLSSSTTKLPTLNKNGSK